MNNLAELRKAKRFLTNEQLESLIFILCNGLRKEAKLRLESILRNSFYSLEDKDYWTRFILDGNYTSYKAKEEVNRKAELKEIRNDILGAKK